MVLAAGPLWQIRIVILVGEIHVLLSVMASTCRPTLMTGNGVEYNVGDSVSFT